MVYAIIAGFCGSLELCINNKHLCKLETTEPWIPQLRIYLSVTNKCQFKIRKTDLKKWKRWSYHT